MQNSTVSEKLTSLRLDGAKQAYLEQALADGYRDMTFEERLVLLLEREEIIRANKALTMRIGKAKFKQKATFEDVKVSAARGLDKLTVQNLGQGEWIRKKQNLLITGASGCGKTFLATALTHRACLCGFSAKYFRFPGLVTELAIAKEEGTQKRLLAHLKKYQVLIVDDFLLSAITEAEQKDLFELVEERHEAASTIFTSQNPVSSWHSLMPNLALSDAILDRIAHGSLRLELKGDSMRKKRVSEIDEAAPGLS